LTFIGDELEMYCFIVSRAENPNHLLFCLLVSLSQSYSASVRS